MKHRIKTAAILLFVFAIAAFGLTTLTSVIIKNSQITNSTINNTQIGNTTPAVAFFSSLMAANAPVSVNQQGGYLSWNTGSAGEMDFIDQKGGGAGGFYWYGANSSNQITSSPMTLDLSGNLTTTSSVHTSNFYGTLNGNVNGNANTATTAGQASAANSLNSAGASNSGAHTMLWGWNGQLTMQVDGSNFGNTLPASISGNANYANSANYAASAGQLSGSPTQCGSGTGQYLLGVQSNGNANCTTYPQSIGSTGYATLPNGLILEWGSAQLPTGNGDFIALPYPFPHGSFTVVASDAGIPTPSSGAYSASAVAKQNGFYGYLRNGQNQFVTGNMAWFALGY